MPCNAAETRMTRTVRIRLVNCVARAVAVLPGGASACQCCRRVARDLVCFAGGHLDGRPPSPCCCRVCVCIVPLAVCRSATGSLCQCVTVCQFVPVCTDSESEARLRVGARVWQAKQNLKLTLLVLPPLPLAGCLTGQPALAVPRTSSCSGAGEHYLCY